MSRTVFFGILLAILPCATLADGWRGAGYEISGEEPVFLVIQNVDSANYRLYGGLLDPAETSDEMPIKIRMTCNKLGERLVSISTPTLVPSLPGSKGQALHPMIIYSEQTGARKFQLRVVAVGPRATMSVVPPDSHKVANMMLSPHEFHITIMGKDPLGFTLKPDRADEMRKQLDNHCDRISGKDRTLPRPSEARQ